MAVSVIDLYKNLLPKTNCKDCGHATCFAFATSVVVEKEDLTKQKNVIGYIQKPFDIDDLIRKVKEALS